jgi:hypothetical protein
LLTKLTEADGAIEGWIRMTPLPLPYGFASVRRMVPSVSKVNPKLTEPCAEVLEPVEGTPLVMGKSQKGGFRPLTLTTRALPLFEKEIWAGPMWFIGGVVRERFKLRSAVQVSPLEVIA